MSALGIWLLTGRELTVLLPNRLARSASWAPTARLGSMFGYGVGYAIASLSCTVGPFLAVTGAGVGGTSVAARVWIYVAYAAGFALVVGALAVAVALAGSALVDRMRRILPYVNRIGGAVLILVGLYVGYYGYYEVRLFNAGGSPRRSGCRGGGPPAGRDRRMGAPTRAVAVDRGAHRTDRSRHSSGLGVGDGPVQVRPWRTTDHSQRGQGRRDQPDQLADQRDPSRGRRRAPRSPHRP